MSDENITHTYTKKRTQNTMTQKNSAQKGKRRDETTENERKDARRAKRRAKRGQKETADWAGVDKTKLCELIELVTADGGTITFGYTRDGGAYYVNYYIDGESEKYYIRPTEDVDEWLTDEISYMAI